MPELTPASCSPRRLERNTVRKRSASGTNVADAMSAPRAISEPEGDANGGDEEEGDDSDDVRPRLALGV